MIIIKEEIIEDPNDSVIEDMKKFAKYLKDNGIEVDNTNFDNKAVYVLDDNDIDDALYILKTEFKELYDKGISVRCDINAGGIDALVSQDINEDILAEDNFEPYTYIKSKEVYDSDGWRTEYTMYYDEVNDRYVFVFGDSDYYNPNDGYEEFDWECDTEKQANDWFDNYTGFEDDLDESCTTKESSDTWDINTAAKQSADAALKNIKQGIEDFEVEINTKVDRPNFWKQFRKEMTENGLDFEIKGKDTEWDDHYYYMYLYKLNDDLDESLKEDTSDLSAKELANSIKDMLSKIKFTTVDLDKSIFDESGTDTYYLILDKVFKALNGSMHTETNYPIEISNTPILFKENNRGTITMLFINVGKEWKITKNGKTSIESVNPYSKKDALLYIYNQLKKLVPGMNESCNIKESSTKSYWKYNQFEDTLSDGDYYDKYTIKRFRLIPCETPEECYEGDVRRFSAWAVCETEYPYKEVFCTKDEAYNYLMDFLNDGRYETIHNL